MPEDEQLCLIQDPAPPAPVDDDEGAVAVFTFFQGQEDLETRISKLLRPAIDSVIDSANTGRYRFQDLEGPEKTYLGIKIENAIRNEFRLERGALDLRVAGHEVDVKFSISGNWMIGKRQVGHLCLVFSANELNGQYSMGIIRAFNEHLRPGKNQDKKGSLSAAAKKRIVWVVRDCPYEKNFLLHLDECRRSKIMAHHSGQQRITELFRLVRDTIIPRSVLVALGQQLDPTRRFRVAKERLEQEGVTLCCGTYLAPRRQAASRGFELEPGECVSFDAKAPIKSKRRRKPR